VSWEDADDVRRAVELAAGMSMPEVHAAFRVAARMNPEVDEELNRLAYLEDDPVTRGLLDYLRSEDE
jgi:hypothetical protein